MVDLPVSNTRVSDASHTVHLRQVRAEAKETVQLWWCGYYCSQSHDRRMVISRKYCGFHPVGSEQERYNWRGDKNSEPPDYKSSPVTGLEWRRRFQEVKVPRFHDNGTGWW